MINPDVPRLANMLLEATVENRKLPDSAANSFFDLTTDNGYEIQKKVIALSKDNVIGWKLGGTNSATRTIFGIDSCYWGPIFYPGLVAENRKLHLTSGEIEIAVKTNMRNSTGILATPKNIGEFIDEIALSVEFPYGVISDYQKAGISSLIADCCASGQVVLGESVPFFEPSSTENINLCVNGSNVLFANSGTLVDGLVSTLCFFINRSRAMGFPILSNQWIFTGGLSPLISFNFGDCVEVISTSLPDLNFTVI
jgi:2-keto-4-pentenoate hydratase